MREFSRAGSNRNPVHYFHSYPDTRQGSGLNKFVQSCYSLTGGCRVLNMTSFWMPYFLARSLIYRDS